LTFCCYTKGNTQDLTRLPKWIFLQNCQVLHKKKSYITRYARQNALDGNPPVMLKFWGKTKTKKTEKKKGKVKTKKQNVLSGT